MTCVKCRVTGRVQGVWFRASTRQQAQPLGIRGYARNLPDGSVEVLACGEEAALRSLKAWLRRGPPMARVDDLTCQTVHPPADLSGFEER
jgi:acylphosphatase